MRRWLFSILMIAACEGGQTGTPIEDARTDLDASVTITCTNGPDAATALGVRGVDLWNAFAGTYTLAANRPAGKSLEAATFTVTVARSDAPIPGLDDCSRVAVPVAMTLQGAGLNETLAGVLRGSLYSADAVFTSPEVLVGQEPRIWGNLLFRQGQEVQLRLRTDKGAAWVAPPLEETP